MVVDNDKNQNGNNNKNDDLEDVEQSLESKFFGVDQGKRARIYVLRGENPKGEKRVRPVVKEYKGEKISKVRFEVLEEEDIDEFLGNGQDEKLVKWFDIGKRSARLFIPKLKEGNQFFEVERVGSGKETLYVPTVIPSTQFKR